MRATTVDSSGHAEEASASAAAGFPEVAGRLPALLDLVTLAGPPSRVAEVLSPSTGAPLGEIPIGSEADVAEALCRARVAQQSWEVASVKERSRIVFRFRDLLLERWSEALDVVQLETGKARRHAAEELLDINLVAGHYGTHAPGLMEPRKHAGAVRGLTRTREHRRPVGVVGVIVPWNYPLSLSVSDSVPALVAGNAVILKPDLQTSFSALWGLALWREAGLPESVLQVVTGDGPGTGRAVVDAVDYVSFTGSTATGRAVGQRAAGRLVGCSLELGGKNPMIVRADANLDAAVAGAVRGCFTNAGQLCIAIERVYVHETLYERFVAALAERARGLRLKPGFDFEADVGSLVSRTHFEKVAAHVEDARAKGVTVVAGGHARPDAGPYFFQPTVLTGVTPDMRLASEETFGPVVAVYPFSSDDEAVALANDTRYGLNASLWTKDVDEGRRMAARIEAGTVNINDAYSATWASAGAPQGGVKDSGLGRRHGAEGLLKFTEAQTISVQRAPALDFMTGPLAGARLQRLLPRLLKLLRRVPGLG